ncbi:hypothetical protein [Glycomyces salinus]|uniref:hypothetical protein n=1 Tax=Glycomyces salinus TaxID=980294 RepID=UPI0018ED93A2|nr:hypothetical protein [Glycomyces salinus]
MDFFAEFDGLDHRQVTSRLLAEGWTVCGLGEWATVWRSPGGGLAARVCPFEPGYQVFVELCRSLSGHRLLPRIEFDAELSGGGRVTVMEFLYPSEPALHEKASRLWEAGEGDFGAVRAEAERLDAEARASLPFWGGLGLNPHNVMTTLSGEVKLVDLYFMSGHELYAALLRDPAAFAEAIPAERYAHLPEIAFIARNSTPDEISELRRAAAVVQDSGRYSA